MEITLQFVEDWEDFTAAALSEIKAALSAFVEV
jgi:hypothetical protein